MNDAAFSARLRRAATELLSEGAFLHRDRDGALYVTDAPRREPKADWPRRFAGAGFACRAEKGLVALTPGAAWLLRLEAEYPQPPDFFSASLIRFAGLCADDEGLALFACGVRALEGEANDFERRLRQRAAVALRSGSDRMTIGGGLYACALIRFLIEEEKKHEDQMAGTFLL